MSKKISALVAQSAAKLYEALHQKHGLPAEAVSTIELEMFKTVVDSWQALIAKNQTKESPTVTEYETALIKHKSKQSFITAYIQRNNCSAEKAEAVYEKLRLKMER